MNRLMNSSEWSDRNSLHASGGGPVMVKLGGAAIDRADEFPALFEAVRNLHKISVATGSGVILVHGGGAAIDRRLDRLGLKSERRAGIRITPAEHIDEVVAELAGSVNKRLVGTRPPATTSIPAASARCAAATPASSTCCSPAASCRFCVRSDWTRWASR